MLAELALPGFIIFFFGVGALIAAAVAHFAETTLLTQGYVFVITSVLTLILGRWCFRKTLRGNREEASGEVNDGVIGLTVEVTEAIEPPHVGRVELHGTEWRAQAAHPIAKGEVVRVVARTGLTLTVE